MDRGAGEGVKILLMKRQDDAEPYWKREFSSEDRKRDAKSGAAESDGSFPIHNSSDLHNAMRAIGRSKNPSKTRAHIRARARALGLTSELSDSFKRNTPMIGKFFQQVFGGSNNNPAIIDKALLKLEESVTSILSDDKVDKGAALTTTFEQFGDHLKETLAAGTAVVKNEDHDMDLKAFAKALGLADTATEADVTAALAKSVKTGEENAKALAKAQVDLQNAQAGYNAAEVAYLQKESLYDEEEDEKKPELSDGDKERRRRKKAFREASHEERAKIMKIADPEVPSYIKKMMEDMEELRKQNATLLQSAGLVGFNKQATDMGLPEAEGVTLQKAYQGDKSAIDKLLTLTKSAINAARTGEVFKEFGSGHSSSTDKPYDQLQAKAAELRKIDPKLTKEQAFAKVYEDPANLDLVRLERSQNRPTAA